MTAPITLLIVDDHNVVRLGLKAYFSTLKDIQVIGEAASGEEAVAFVAQHKPDVVLMDLIMPGMDGVEATQRLKKASPATEVIVLTSFHDDEHIFPAIRAGALSYILKDVDPDDLAIAVRLAYAGEAVINPRVAARVMKELGGMRQDAPNAFRELTGRELEVLRLVAAGKSNRRSGDQRENGKNPHHQPPVQAAPD